MCLSIKVNNPDCVLEDGEYRGYEYIVVKTSMGHRCGYVKVTKGHPWHGKDWENVSPINGDEWLDVHGGLTFAEADVPCDAEGPDTGWWIGFDCAHSGDAKDESIMSDEYLKYHRDFNERHPDLSRITMHESVKTTPYVVNECKRLIDQAVQ